MARKKMEFTVTVDFDPPTTVLPTDMEIILEKIIENYNPSQIFAACQGWDLMNSAKNLILEGFQAEVHAKGLR